MKMIPNQVLGRRMGIQSQHQQHQSHQSMLVNRITPHQQRAAARINRYWLHHNQNPIPTTIQRNDNISDVTDDGSYAAALALQRRNSRPMPPGSTSSIRAAHQQQQQQHAQVRMAHNLVPPDTTTGVRIRSPLASTSSTMSSSSSSSINHPIRDARPAYFKAA
jgi:hypothetical protein